MWKELIKTRTEGKKEHEQFWKILKREDQELIKPVEGNRPVEDPKKEVAPIVIPKPVVVQDIVIDKKSIQIETTMTVSTAPTTKKSYTKRAATGKAPKKLTLK